MCGGVSNFDLQKRATKYFNELIKSGEFEPFVIFVYWIVSFLQKV